MAEAGSSKQTQTVPARLSIYDSPGAPILLVPEAPSTLQLQISSVRKAAQSIYGDLSQRVRLASNQWIGAEHKLEHELSTLRAKDEPLTPGAFYVGISTLLGSIVTRNRLLPLRIITPPTFLIASTACFLPKHFENTTSYIATLEKTYTPQLYHWQLQFSTRLQSLKIEALKLAARGQKATQDIASRASPWLKTQTGLNLPRSESIQSRDGPQA